MYYHDRPHFLLLSICAVQFLLVAFLAPILGTFSTPSAEVFRRRNKKKISFFIRNESNREQLLSRKFLLLLLFWVVVVSFLPNRQPPRDSTAIIIMTKERSPPTIRYVILDVSSLSLSLCILLVALVSRSRISCFFSSSSSFFWII